MTWTFPEQDGWGLNCLIPHTAAAMFTLPIAKTWGDLEPLFEPASST